MKTLDELVTQYGTKHFEELALKKECTEINNKIKGLLTDNNLDEYVSGDYKVKKVIAVTESLNEDQLLQVLMQDWTSRNGSMQCPYVKTKCYVDMEALESALYKGEIPEDTVVEMNKCKTTKETVKLNLTKVKKEESDNE